MTTNFYTDSVSRRAAKATVRYCDKATKGDGIHASRSRKRNGSVVRIEEAILIASTAACAKR